MKTFDPVNVLTASALLARIASDAQARSTAAATALALEQNYASEVNTNTLCTATLAELDTRIDALIDPVSNLTEAKMAMKVALKKVARCLRARLP